MKKRLAPLLFAVLLLCLCGCDIDTTSEDTTFSAHMSSYSASETSSAISAADTASHTPIPVATSNPEENTSQVSSHEEAQESQESAENQQEETVLITFTGTKYHLRKCGNGTYWKTNLRDAKSKGLTPCSKCY